MSGTRMLVRKEFRALIGAWLTITAGMLAGELRGLHDLRELAVVGYGAGAAALGALSIGHELRYGTLSQLLAQPVPRMRLLAIKTGVLTLLLAGLAAVAVIFPLSHARWPVKGLRSLAILPVLYAICVAPWITMKTRNVIAGTLFTGSIGSLLFIASYFWATARYVSPDDVDASRLAFVWAGSAIACATGAVGLWTTFRGLEVQDAAPAELQLPAAWRSQSASDNRRTVRHPVLRLVGKELRLQQLTFAASLLYAVLYLAAAAIDPIYVARHDILVAGTAIHAIVIAAMSGALSCAEERALGTHEWQLLQPMSARAQFAIKIAVVATLALVLAFGLPAILSLVPGGATESWPAGQRARAIPAILALTAGSVYISSLATSGLTALLLCIPGFIGVSMFINWFVPQVAFRAFMFFYRLPNGRLSRPLYRTSGSVDLLLACALILAVLWLAFSNHRESGRSFTRASLQLGVLAALILAVYTAFSAAGHAL